jgi:hypothetical protein
MTGPSPERWDDMKMQAYKDLFNKLVGDGIWTPPKGDDDGTIMYPVRDRRVQQEVLPGAQPSPNGDGDSSSDPLEAYLRMAGRYRETLLRESGYFPNTYSGRGLFQSNDQDICPRCGQDRRRVRHCDPSAGFRREGFVDDPEPVKLTFDEVIDGEVLAVDQPELEQ